MTQVSQYSHTAPTGFDNKGNTVGTVVRRPDTVHGDFTKAHRLTGVKVVQVVDPAQVGRLLRGDPRPGCHVDRELILAVKDSHRATVIAMVM